MGEDGGAGLTWQKLLMYIFMAVSFIVLFALLMIVLVMPSLRS